MAEAETEAEVPLCNRMFYCAVFNLCNLICMSV